MARKRVLVTGGSGFVGSWLVKNLVKSHFVRVLDLAECKVEGVESVVGDILDPKTVEKSLKGVDVVYHLAAQISIPYSFENPDKDCEINVIGTINLLRHCDKVEKVIYGSTSSVYGPAQYSPADEGHPINPVTPYAMSKFCSEKYCELFARIKGFNLAIVRLSSPYGLGTKGVIAAFFDRAKKGEDLKIFGTGEQKRAYLYIEDVAGAYAALLDGGQGVYNIGHSEEVTFKEIAQKIIDVAGSKSRIVHEEQRGTEENLPTLDATKAKKELGWEPTISFDEGLRKMYQTMEAG